MTRENDDSVLALRLQLLANGYSPIPNRDKRTFMKGWPTVELTAAEITSWERRFRRDRATGLRIENGLCALDFDIDHPVVDRIADRILDICPQLDSEAVRLLVRRGKGRKEAWFMRCDEPFSRIFTRRWVAPGSTEDDCTHSVEIFGGAAHRQFGAFGPHTRQDDGTVTVTYRWDDASPADTPLADLPEITKAQAFAIVDMAEEEMEAAGMTPVLRSEKGESDAVRVYDLVDAMQFELHDGRSLSLSELRDVAQAQEGLRCSASFIEGPTAKRTDRCLISVTASGNLAIWESASGVTHMEEAAQGPVKRQQLQLDRLAEKMQELRERRANKPSSNDSALTVANKMVGTYAFCPSQSKAPVVPLWADNIEGGLTMSNFRTLMLPYAEEEVGPRGGRKLVNPVDIWAGSNKRITVEGMQLRPDMPRPVFDDPRGKWINAYDPPLHDATGGSPDVGVEFLEHLVPDQRERHWWTCWMAYKERFPHIPGPGVVMVAHGVFGTGRGTLFTMMGHIYGRRYVKEMPYSIIAGRTYQSQYTDWAADTLIACVNESSETEAGHTFQMKKNTYERLKELIDPMPVERTFVTRGARPFKALSCTSYVIGTNHMDAIPIPADDRRLAVLRNGPALSQELAERVWAWMENPANIAAFVQWLRAYDIGDYSPFAPPLMTKSKELMADEAVSDLDRGLAIAIREMASDVMTPEQVVAAMQRVQREHRLEYPDRWQPIAKRLLRGVLHRVGVRDSTNWQIRVGSTKMAVYARSLDAASKWEIRAGLRDEVGRNESGLHGDDVISVVDRVRKLRDQGQDVGTEKE